MPVYEKTAGGYFYKTLKTTNKKVRISEEEFKRNNKNGKEVRGGADGIATTNTNKKKYAFDCVCSPAKNKNITPPPNKPNQPNNPIQLQQTNPI